MDGSARVAVSPFTGGSPGKRILIRAAWIVFALLGASAHAGGLTVVDDAGNSVTLAKPARRIVSLAPHATEMLFAVGAGRYVVGAVAYSDYPEAARRIPRVGGYESFDLERIASMKPDLVIAWRSGNPSTAVQRLKDLGMTIYFSEPRRMEDVVTNMERLGQLAGTEETGRRATAAFHARYQALRQRYGHRPQVSVFYEIWHQPLLTVNGEHLISQVITLCGGRNVFAAFPVLTPEVDLEAVLQADPEVIIAGGMDKLRPEWLEEWRRYPVLRAVRDDNLFFVPPDLIQRSGPRILDGAEQLCQALEQAREKQESAHGR
jgi:iron complex transport system substrate-binding protein